MRLAHRQQSSLIAASSSVERESREGEEEEMR